MDLNKIKSNMASLYASLRATKKAEFDRHVSFGDMFTDRWETARFMGFGEGASCYDNVLVMGDVTVGKNTWIGPNVILDGGSGRLEIGDFGALSFVNRDIPEGATRGAAPHEFRETTSPLTECHD